MPRIALLLLLSSSWAAAAGCGRCCRVVEDFPARLKRLRLDYARIRDVYESKNSDLDTPLLDQTVEDSFKSRYACQAVGGVLGFYLNTVLPTATVDVESIRQIFDRTKSDMARCKHYFGCKKRFNVKTLQSTYAQLASEAPSKAMGELGMLFNYMETYVASKRVSVGK